MHELRMARLDFGRKIKHGVVILSLKKYMLIKSVFDSKVDFSLHSKINHCREKILFKPMRSIL